MALRQPVYAVSIHGAGPGFHRAYADLEETTHLDVGACYLVLGDEARVRVTAHDGQGDVRVEADLAGVGTLPGDDAIEADTEEIEEFVAQISGARLQWDEATRAWSLPGFAPVAGQPPVSTHHEAALAALRATVAVQRR